MPFPSATAPSSPISFPSKLQHVKVQRGIELVRPLTPIQSVSCSPGAHHPVLRRHCPQSGFFSSCITCKFREVLKSYSYGYLLQCLQCLIRIEGCSNGGCSIIANLVIHQAAAQERNVQWGIELLGLLTPSASISGCVEVLDLVPLRHHCRSRYCPSCSK